LQLSADNYTAVERFITGENAICGEVSERASAASFAEFSRQIRKFNQPVQCSSSRAVLTSAVAREVAVGVAVGLTGAASE